MGVKVQKGDMDFLGYRELRELSLYLEHRGAWDIHATIHLDPIGYNIKVLSNKVYLMNEFWCYTFQRMKMQNRTSLKRVLDQLNIGSSSQNLQ